MDRRFVDHLVNQGLVTKQQLQRLILLASQDKKGLISQLVDAQVVDQARLAKEVGHYHNLKVHHDSHSLPDPELLELLPVEVARKLGVLPLSQHKGQISVWVFDPQLCQRALIHLEEASGHTPHVLIGTRDEVLGMIERAYAQEASTLEEHEPREEAKRQKKASGSLGRIQPRRIAVPRSQLEADSSRAHSHRATSDEDGVDSAIDDFEQLLDEDDGDISVSSPRSSFAGRAQRLALNPGVPAKAAPQAQNEDPWASNQTAVNTWSWDDFEKDEEKPHVPSSKGGAEQDAARSRRRKKDSDSFSLFELSDVSSDTVSVEERLEEQTHALHALQDELQRQREVVQALADILMEEGLLNRRNLSKRIKELRRSKG